MPFYQFEKGRTTVPRIYPRTNHQVNQNSSGATTKIRTIVIATERVLSGQRAIVSNGSQWNAPVGIAA